MLYYCVSEGGKISGSFLREACQGEKEVRKAVEVGMGFGTVQFPGFLECHGPALGPADDGPGQVDGCARGISARENELAGQGYFSLEF